MELTTKIKQKATNLRDGIRRKLRKGEKMPYSSFELAGMIALTLREEKVCRYCNQRLTIKTISLDHIIPLSREGTNHPKNLQLICLRCNRRKGELKGDEYDYILSWLGVLPDEAQAYVLRKLSSSPRFGR